MSEQELVERMKHLAEVGEKEIMVGQINWPEIFRKAADRIAALEAIVEIDLHQRGGGW